MATGKEAPGQEKDEGGDGAGCSLQRLGDLCLSQKRQPRQLVCGWKGRPPLYLGFEPVVLLPAPLLLLPFIIHFHKLEIVLAISLLRVGQGKLKL